MNFLALPLLTAAIEKWKVGLERVTLGLWLTWLQFLSTTECVPLKKGKYGVTREILSAGLRNMPSI